jgi:hypothetical protein
MAPLRMDPSVRIQNRLRVQKEPGTIMTNVQNNTGKNDPAIPEFINKESFTTLGITRDFIWFESEILLREMRQWENRLTRLVKVMEERHKDQEKMIENIMSENRQLKKQLKDKS